MKIWLEVTPLYWNIWPLKMQEWDADKGYVRGIEVGPLAVYWQDENKK